MQSEKTFLPPNRYRLLWIAVAISMLAAMYLFQRFNFLGAILSLVGQNHSAVHPYYFFIFNKTCRLTINDFSSFILIFALFNERKYMKVALGVFLFEIVFLLPLYFVLKLSLEGDSEISSPLLSQLHRLIVNPTLMFLLIAAFLYQRFKEVRIP